MDISCMFVNIKYIVGIHIVSDMFLDCKQIPVIIYAMYIKPIKPSIKSSNDVAPWMFIECFLHVQRIHRFFNLISEYIFLLIWFCVRGDVQTCIIVVQFFLNRFCLHMFLVTVSQSHPFCGIYKYEVYEYISCSSVYKHNSINRCTLNISYRYTKSIK